MVFTLLATLFVFLVLVYFGVKSARPTYRINRENVINLLDDVLEGRAKTKDWLVFTAIPIRYDASLEAIRISCLDIEERHLLGDASRFLFDRHGLEKLQEIKRELQSVRQHTHL